MQSLSLEEWLGKSTNLAVVLLVVAIWANHNPLVHIQIINPNDLFRFLFQYNATKNLPFTIGTRNDPLCLENSYTENGFGIGRRQKKGCGNWWGSRRFPHRKIYPISFWCHSHWSVWTLFYLSLEIPCFCYWHLNLTLYAGFYGSLVYFCPWIKFCLYQLRRENKREMIFPIISSKLWLQQSPWWKKFRLILCLHFALELVFQSDICFLALKLKTNKLLMVKQS